MSFINKTIEEIKKEYLNDKVYKLCYVETIEPYVMGYRPEIKEKYKFLEDMPYEQWKHEYYKYPEYRMEDLPNPDYKKGEHELLAYFTPLELSEQWGDDWDDAPYEHNAGTPYDDITVSTRTTPEGIVIADKTEDVPIITVPFAVHSYNYSLPREYGYLNSPFSVLMINGGAVAWIFDAANGKLKNMTSIYGGITLGEFVEKLEAIDRNNPEYEISSEDDE